MIRFLPGSRSRAKFQISLSLSLPPLCMPYALLVKHDLWFDFGVVPEGCCIELRSDVVRGV